MAKKKTTTPGPWAVRKHWCDSEKYEVYPVRDGKPSFGEYGEIAEVSSGADGESAKKNAMLMAAAPELLEACQMMLVCMKLANWEGDEAAIRARAAIQRATGEKP